MFGTRMVFHPCGTSRVPSMTLPFLPSLDSAYTGTLDLHDMIHGVCDRICIQTADHNVCILISHLRNEHSLCDFLVDDVLEMSYCIVGKHTQFYHAQIECAASVSLNSQTLCHICRNIGTEHSYLLFVCNVFLCEPDNLPYS